MLFTEFNMDDARRVWSEEGKLEGLIKTALNMLKKGMDVSLISDVTGLSEKEIEKLKGKAIKIEDKKQS